MSESKVCPREPTQSMEYAVQGMWGRVAHGTVAQVWRAMYDAAPAPPQADAEALLRAVVEAWDRPFAAGANKDSADRLLPALDAARAYFAAREKS